MPQLQVCQLQTTQAVAFAVGHELSLRSDDPAADEEDKRILQPSAPFVPKKRAQWRPADATLIEPAEPVPMPPQPVRVRRASSRPRTIYDGGRVLSFCKQSLTGVLLFCAPPASQAAAG